MSSKTVFIQGVESPKIIKMVEKLLGLNDSEADQSAQEEKSPNPKKKKRRKSSKKPKKDSEKSYCFKKDEICKLWEAIDDIKRMLNSTRSLGKANSPQVFPRVLVSNRYNILYKSRDNSNDCNDITNKENCYDSPAQEEKSKEIERLRAIISESEEKIVRLEKQLSNKDKTIQVLKTKVSSLEAEKCKQKEKVEELQKKSNCKPTADKPTGKPVEKKTTDVKEEPSLSQPRRNTHKPRIIIAGDSMVRDLKGWLMSRSKFVKVFSFSGATTEDMKSYLVPLIEKKPDHIILNIGTNHLTGDTPESIVEKILGLADMITSKGIKCSVSQLIIRNDQLWHKGKRVNQILSERLPKHISLVSSENITVNH